MDALEATCPVCRSAWAEVNQTIRFLTPCSSSYQIAVTPHLHVSSLCLILPAARWFAALCGAGCLASSAGSDHSRPPFTRPFSAEPLGSSRNGDSIPTWVLFYIGISANGWSKPSALIRVCSQDYSVQSDLNILWPGVQAKPYHAASG